MEKTGEKNNSLLQQKEKARIESEKEVAMR